MAGIEFILIGLMTIAPGPHVQPTYINRFTTITACEASAQALRQGNSPSQQERQFVCMKYDPSK